MKQVLQHIRSGKLELAEVPEPALRAGGILVKNACSLISAGTEKMIIDFAGKSLIGKARERPDLVKRVLDKVRKDGITPTLGAVFGRLDQPVPLGYSCAGTVLETGVDVGDFAPGDRVGCAGMGYASHAHVVFVPKNLAVPIPANVSFEDASYVTLGAIALQGVRVAAVELGESVAVIGLGLLGLLVTQILKAAGCLVVGIDLDPAKAALALELGADLALERKDSVSSLVKEFTGGIGVDAVIIAAATDSNDPVELAGEIARDRGRVSVIGAVRMDVPRKVYYEKELQLRLSRSYGPGRYDPAYEEQGRDYPIAYVRWTERRNMQEFLRLVSCGAVSPSKLTSHRFPIETAEKAYEVVAGTTSQPFAGVILEYDGGGRERRKTVAVHARQATHGAVGIGFIGAGNFARAILLPRFKRAAGVDLAGIATANGATGKSAGVKFGFRYATTDIGVILDDPTVSAVVIATPHGSHPGFVARALRAGKSVFVEKPLAVDRSGLDEVMGALAETRGLLVVGFNRRFSGLARELKNALSPNAPIAVTYRVNAGPVPRGSWLLDPREGGGRIVGEVCHFVDFLQFLTDSPLTEVFATALAGQAGQTHDTIAVNLRFANGSIATISYFANGDKSFAKERIEVFSGGVIGVLDDFRALTISANGKRNKSARMSQDKGYDQEISAFLAAVRTGGAPPISVDSLFVTTQATFAIEESLRSGRPVNLSL